VSEQTVVSFPLHGFAGGHYEYWLGWAECELSILGFDLKEVAFDWRAAFDCGLKPEQAAAEAAKRAQPPQRTA
jgi:hypothetical protein